jgi:hypothetical protein
MAENAEEIALAGYGAGWPPANFKTAALNPVELCHVGLGAFWSCSLSAGAFKAQASKPLPGYSRITQKGIGSRAGARGGLKTRRLICSSIARRLIAATAG